MTFTARDWSDGDIFDAADADRIENGLADVTTSDAAKYTKPGSGIPSTDLTSAVQTSLGKADAALPSATVGITLTIKSTTSWPARPTFPSGVCIRWVDVGGLGTQPSGAVDGDTLIAAS